MTTVNLIAQLLTDDYPVVYMAETDIMREAMDAKRGGSFHGSVGEIANDGGTEQSYYPMFLPDKDLGTIEVLDISEDEQGNDLVSGKWTTGPALENRDPRIQITPQDPEEPSLATTIQVPCCSMLQNRAGMLGSLRGRRRHWRLWPSESTALDVRTGLFIVPLLLSVVVVLIVYELTHFKPRASSTLIQRGFITA